MPRSPTATASLRGMDQTPAAFWRPLRDDISAVEWEAAARLAQDCLAGLPVLEQALHPDQWAARIATEAQFGTQHWTLSVAKRFYYRIIRPLLPAFLRSWARRVLLRRQRRHGLLAWPIEDRFLRFRYETVRHVLASKSLQELPYIAFWPDGKKFAFVLTHDVESQAGQAFALAVAELDEKYGFQSSFNFAPEEYPVDQALLRELRQRGFEIGVHGLKHDGRLFSSWDKFAQGVEKINGYLRAWEAVGFRSPMTHRNPEWMQALEIEYDSSFFDTDPFEPLPGGTMSIWPFQMGRFIELPYTLAQDHTMFHTLGEKTLRLWLEKIAFIREHSGMALVNVHPDYLRQPALLALYEDLLAYMREDRDHWHALPREVARWWRRRTGASTSGVREDLAARLPGGSIGVIRITSRGIEVA